MKKENTTHTKEGLHTQGEQWSLNTSNKGNYCITIEMPNGYKPICTLTDDSGYLSKEAIRLAGIEIVKAVNERQALLDSHRELLDALHAFCDLRTATSNDDFNNCYHKAKTAINNAKNIKQ